MKREILHRNFLEVLKKKIPEKTDIVEMLMELLYMEKGAVYRRLRGEVPFSFYEAVNIAEKLNIPINNFVYTYADRVDRFEMSIKSTDMNAMDYKHWEHYISMISSAKSDPLSESAESSNVLSLSIFARCDSLLKYFLFKYQCLNSGTESRTSFKDLEVPQRLFQIIKEYYNESKHFAKTIYIWDYLIFHYVVNDVKYFSSINMISNDEVQLIKSDLYNLLDYIEKITINGYFEETGNPVLIYKSDLHLDTIYSYMQFNDVYVSLVRTFILNSVVSVVKSSFDIMKKWIQSLIKSSILITKSGALYRTEFFEKQRQFISEL